MQHGRGRALKSDEGKTYIFSLVLLLAQVVLREEVLAFSSVHVKLTVCKHTTKINSVSPGRFLMRA